MSGEGGKGTVCAKAPDSSAHPFRQEVLAAELGSRIRFDEPLRLHTSFRIGGPADFFFVASNRADLAQALKLFASIGIPVFILGAGTNVLVADAGVRGAVVRLGGGFAKCAWLPRGQEGVELRAGAAVRMSRVVAEATRRGLTGIEFAEGIPGTVGGAMVMNAGAFGGEMSSVVLAIEGMDFAGEEFCLKRDELTFEYRRLLLPRRSLITAAHFRLRRGEPQAIRRRLEEIRSRRRATQPLHLPNAGSIFRNPRGRAAGQLIQDAGLKGLRIGAAEVSPQHGNFIVNLGGARAADVAALIEHVRARVNERFGVQLELEIKLVGEW